MTVRIVDMGLVVVKCQDVSVPTKDKIYLLHHNMQISYIKIKNK